MLNIFQPKNDSVDEDETYDEVLPHEKYAQTNQLFQCHVNQMSQL